MKTKFVMSLLLSLALVFVSSAAFAAVITVTAGGKADLGTGTNAATVNFSKNVNAAYASNGTAYALGALHQSGAREYATSNSLGGIYVKNCTDATTPCGNTTTTIGATSVFDETATGWTVQ